MKRTVWFAAILLPVLLAGCSSGPDHYRQEEVQERKCRPGQSLVVLAGFADELSVRFAAELTGLLEENSMFTVMGQDDMKAAFPEYPATILSSRATVSEMDLPKFQRIQQRLGTDYILVAWCPTKQMSSINNVDTRLTVGFKCQLLGFPGAQRLGWSEFFETVPLALTGPQPKDQVTAVQAGSGSMVSEFLRQTGMRR